MSFEDELRRIADALAAERGAAATAGTGLTDEVIERQVGARLADAEARARAAGRAEGYGAALGALERERDASFVEGREAGIVRGRDIGRSEGWEAGRAEGWAAGRVEGLSRGADSLTGGRAADTDGAPDASRQHQEGHKDGQTLARLTRALRLIDGGSSLTEILDALASSASHEAARVGVLLVNRAGGTDPSGAVELRGWHFAGFDSSRIDVQNARQFTLALAEAGLIAEAVRGGEHETGAGRKGHVASEVSAGKIEQRGEPDGSRLPAFARGPGDTVPTTLRAVAIPIALGGEYVGVLYGDQPSDAGDDGSWSAMLEILARHASVRLEAITALRCAQLRAES